MAPHNRFLVYDKDILVDQEDVPLAEALERMKASGTGWLTLYAPTPEEYEMLEKVLELHPLALEDSRNQRQRPKVEAYPTHAYIVARSMARDEEGELRSRQTNIFFQPGLGGWVLVIHDRAWGLFQGVRDRVRKGRTRIRSGGADYLVYTLLDAVVDTLFPHLAEIGEKIEDLEDRMEEDLQALDLEAIHLLKRDLRRLHRTAWPTRELVGALFRDESIGFKKQTVPFLRDVHDHTAQAMDLIDNHREAASSLTDLYLKTISNRQNEVMKVLTIVATIFIPLTFIASIYGMNFEHMPELGTRFGYPAVLLLMFVIVTLELWYFRRRSWI